MKQTDIVLIFYSVVDDLMWVRVT